MAPGGAISASLQLSQLLAHCSIDCVKSWGADDCEESVREDCNIGLGGQKRPPSEGVGLRRFGNAGWL